MPFIRYMNGKISFNISSAVGIFLISGIIGGYTTALMTYFSIRNDIENLKFVLEIQKEDRRKEIFWLKDSITRIEKILENNHAKPSSI